MLSTMQSCSSRNFQFQFTLPACARDTTINKVESICVCACQSYKSIEERILNAFHFSLDFGVINNIV